MVATATRHRVKTRDRVRERYESAAVADLTPEPTAFVGYACAKCGAELPAKQAFHYTTETDGGQLLFCSRSHQPRSADELKQIPRNRAIRRVV